MSWPAAVFASTVVVAAVGAGGAEAQVLPDVASPQTCISGQDGQDNEFRGTQNNDCHQNSTNEGLTGNVLSPQTCVSGQGGQDNKFRGTQNNDCHQNSTNTAPPTPPAPKTIYYSIPDDLPGNVASLGYEATKTSEFGDEVEFDSGTNRRLHSMEVVLSSFACETGSANDTTCMTTPGATFKHPITMNIYAVDDSGTTPAPGALLATKTKNSSIPFRPSADTTNCGTSGRWFDASSSTCFRGFADRLKFNFGGNISLPDKVIWTVAFNTTHAGANPIGEGAACYSTPDGCPYDKLNVGAQTFPGAPYEGIDVDPDAAFLNSNNGSSYCDGGAGGTGFLRYDAPCWTDNKPLGKIDAT